MLLTVESDVQVLGDNINDSTADRIKWCVIGDIRLHSGLSSAWVGLRRAAGVFVPCLNLPLPSVPFRAFKTLKHVSGAEGYPRMSKKVGEDRENLQQGKGNEQSFTPSTTVCTFDSSLSRSRSSVDTLCSSRVNRKSLVFGRMSSTILYFNGQLCQSAWKIICNAARQSLHKQNCWLALCLLACSCSWLAISRCFVLKWMFIGAIMCNIQLIRLQKKAFLHLYFNAWEVCANTN